MWFTDATQLLIHKIMNTLICLPKFKLLNYYITNNNFYNVNKLIVYPASRDLSYMRDLYSQGTNCNKQPYKDTRSASY